MYNTFIYIYIYMKYLFLVLGVFFCFLFSNICWYQFGTQFWEKIFYKNINDESNYHLHSR